MFMEKALNGLRYARNCCKAGADHVAGTRPDKTVRAHKLLNEMDDCTAFTLDGAGSAGNSNIHISGCSSGIRMTCPNVISAGRDETAASGTDGAYTWLLCRVENEDWSAYNRLSFWVYPDCGGLQAVGIEIRLCSGGVESRHFLRLGNRRWSLAIWEFTEIPRGKVEKLLIGYRATGALQNMAADCTFYFNRLQLEEVEADYLEGWGLQKRIAYCHSGYAVGGRKNALLSGSDAKEFSVLESRSRKPAFTGEIKNTPSALGEFQLLDFTGLEKSGEYMLSVNRRCTQPFQIGQSP